MSDVSAFSSAPSDRPIFVLASSHRSGSTLLQRLLNSCPVILIWGEQHGYLNSFMKGFHNLLDWQSRVPGHLKIFLKEGYDNFVPNMVPEERELRAAAAIHIEALFGIPATKRGRPIWGFKEVRYGVQIALFLQECFPKARFIHLNRNIIDCFISLKHWEDSSDPWNRQWTKHAIETWERINSGFLKSGDKISNLLNVRYEDMVADSKGFIQKLAQFLEMPPDSFDQTVFNTRIHAAGSAGTVERRKIHRSDLNAEERALMSTPGIVEIAAAYGYKIEFTDESIHHSTCL